MEIGGHLDTKPGTGLDVNVGEDTALADQLQIRKSLK